jgi:hypothetical protein
LVSSCLAQQGIHNGTGDALLYQQGQSHYQSTPTRTWEKNGCLFCSAMRNTPSFPLILIGNFLFKMPIQQLQRRQDMIIGGGANRKGVCLEVTVSEDICNFFSDVSG